MPHYSPDNISDDIRNYCDKFFRTVIKNTILYYFRDVGKLQNANVSVGNIDDYLEIIPDSEAEEEIYKTEHIKIKDILFETSDPQLGQALNDLTVSQRTVILENIILGYTLSEIADELHICLRMVQKHKRNALRKLKEEMGGDDNDPGQKNASSC